jgi:hypothetical protein
MTKDGHNHPVNRNVFSMKIAVGDSSMILLDIIGHGARERPGLRANDLFVHFVQPVDTDYEHLLVKKKQALKNLIGRKSRNF